MRKPSETDEFLIKVYNLVESFIAYYQPRYFYQYTGDIKDLSSELFLDMLTPGKRRGTTILDDFKMDRPLEPYVKTWVIHFLIDYSRWSTRTHQDHVVYLTEECEKFGDLALYHYGITSSQEQDEPIRLSKEELSSRFNTLDEDKANELYIALLEDESPYASALKPKLHYYHGQAIQQITDRTIVMYDPKRHRSFRWNLSDGKAKGSLRGEGCDIPEKDLPFFKRHVNYHSQFSKNMFDDYCKYESMLNSEKI